MFFVKSTLGIFTVGACAFHSVSHSDGVRTVTCFASCCSLALPFATSVNDGGVCADNIAVNTIR